MGYTHTAHEKEPDMTLFKQITIILSIFLLIILTLVMVLNFESANKSVQERLYQDAKNTASSLSLSLGTANGDISTISTMINANFDSGNYAYISLIDIESNIIYERKAEEEQMNVPQWFINTLKINAPIAVANVSAGWSQVGILKVQSDVSYAYTELYSIFKNLVISFVILAFITLLILNILLIKVLQPLKLAQQQAEAITQNKFILQNNIPRTKELKDVVLAMNQMVIKVKAMLEKANEELKYQKQLEYIDKVTGLKNRKYFINKLPEYLKQDAEVQGGANILIALNGITKANQILGRKGVDKLFKNIAQVLIEHTATYINAIVVRMNGTEFAIFIPDCTQDTALRLAKNIKTQTSKLIQTSGLDTNAVCLSIGIYVYNHKQTIEELLSYSDNALAQAKFNNEIHVEKSETVIEVMGKESWKNIITTAIKTNNIRCTPCNVIDTTTNEVIYKVLTLTLYVNETTSYSYGQFMALAHQLGLSRQIYDNVLHLLFSNPNANLTKTSSSIRLSYEYLKFPDTYDKMEKLFKAYAHSLPFKLTIGMPDKFVNKNTEQVKEYKKLFERYNIDMGIFEFIGESSDYIYLQDLRPAYIKGQPHYFISQNRHTIAALKRITDTLNIALIATGVSSIKEVKRLQEKDIYIVQGKVTELL
jgi:diguanylate cyclase (GGDEF)-like protein